MVLLSRILSKGIFAIKVGIYLRIHLILLAQMKGWVTFPLLCSGLGHHVVKVHLPFALSYLKPLESV